MIRITKTDFPASERVSASPWSAWVALQLQSRESTRVPWFPKLQVVDLHTGETVYSGEGETASVTKQGVYFWRRGRVLLLGSNRRLEDTGIAVDRDRWVGASPSGTRFIIEESPGQAHVIDASSRMLIGGVCIGQEADWIGDDELAVWARDNLYRVGIHQDSLPTRPWITDAMMPGVGRDRVAFWAPSWKFPPQEDEPSPRLVVRPLTGKPEVEYRSDLLAGELWMLGRPCWTDGGRLLFVVGRSLPDLSVHYEVWQGVLE